ncbi:lysylphosphatidylglycerol synthase domain-containing protein [Geodermatophilus sp. SYSU D00779]
MTGDVARPPTTSDPAGTAAAPGRRPADVRGVLLAWGRRVVVATVIGLAVLQVVREWDEVSATLRQLPWPHVLLALVAVSGGVLLGPLVWRAALAAMGARVGVADAAEIYLVGQLGKYVPGSVVAFVLQMELARSAGVSRARGLTASLLTAGVAGVTSLLVGLLAVPALAGSEPVLLWMFALLPVGLALLHPTALTFAVDRLLALLRQAPLPRRLAGGAIARASGLSLLVHLLYGLQLFLLVDALPAGATNRALLLVLCVGTMGVAMTAGLVAFVLPSGIGARELVIVGALAAVLPYGQALALALVSRVLFTVVELASAAAAVLAARLSARRGTPA